MNRPRPTPVVNSSLRPRPAASGRVVPGRPISEPPRRVGSSPRVLSQPLPRFDGGGSRIPRGLRIAVLGGVAAASAFGVLKIRDVVEETQHFPLQGVSAVGDALDDPALRDSVLAYADLQPGVPFFGIDTDAVARRVEAHPFVREAVVRRSGADTLEINIHRREAAAILRIDGASYLVDLDGEVMKRVRAGDEANFPVITLAPTSESVVEEGVDSPTSMNTEVSKRRLSSLTAAVGLVEAATTVGVIDDVSEIVEVPAVGFEVVLLDGSRVRVGADDHVRKLRQFRRANAQLKAAGKRFSTMWLDDARRPERVAVRLRSSVETRPRGG